MPIAGGRKDEDVSGSQAREFRHWAGTGRELAERRPRPAPHPALRQPIPRWPRHDDEKAPGNSRDNQLATQRQDGPGHQPNRSRVSPADISGTPDDSKILLGKFWALMLSEQLAELNRKTIRTIATPWRSADGRQAARNRQQYSPVGPDRAPRTRLDEERQTGARESTFAARSESNGIVAVPDEGGNQYPSGPNDQLSREGKRRCRRLSRGFRQSRTRGGRGPITGDEPAMTRRTPATAGAQGQATVTACGRDHVAGCRGAVHRYMLDDRQELRRLQKGTADRVAGRARHHPS